MELEKMLLLTGIFLMAVRDVQPQVTACMEDVHCIVGYFCVARTQSCHECFNCEKLGRNSSLISNACIKSVNQCGPCLPGYIKDAVWDAVCVPASSGRLQKTYLMILASCVAAGLLLSVYLAQSLWSKNVVNVNIVFMFAKVKDQTELLV